LKVRNPAFIPLSPLAIRLLAIVVLAISVCVRMRYFSALLLALLLSVQGSDKADTAGGQVCNEESDNCGPQYLMQTSAQAKRVSTEEAEEHPEDAATWEAMTTFSGNLDDCMAEMLDGASDVRKEALTLIRDAEVQQKAVELGLVKDHSIRDAAVMAGRAAAQNIVLEDFNESLISTLSQENRTGAMIDKFVLAVDHLARACNDSGEAERVSQDEKALLTNEDGHMTKTEALVAMDLAVAVQDRCQESVMDIDWFFHHAAALTNADTCGPMTADALLETTLHQAKKHDAHVQTVLALHNEDNQLGHHFVKHLKHLGNGVFTEEDFWTAQADKLKEAALSDLSKPQLARLRNLEKKNFKLMYGADKREFCAQYDALKASTPDHWLVQSNAVSKVHRCMCIEDEVSLICEARYQPEIQQEQPSALKRFQTSVEQQKEVFEGNSSSALAVAPGPCAEPVVGYFCIAGTNCIDTSATGGSINVFGKIKALLNGPENCMSAGINFNFGWPAVDCTLKLRIQLSVNIGSCQSVRDIMLTFYIALGVDLCLGGTFGKLLSILGWAACVRIAEIRYYTFIGKLQAEFNLPVWSFIVGIRANFKIGGPVHSLTNPVQSVINNANSDWWAKNAFRAACPGCSGTSSAALVQEGDELEAEGEGGSNVGFWRRRRRRQPRRRRTHCQESTCNGGSSKAYWQTKFNQARGVFFVEVNAQVLVGVKLGFIEIGKWVTAFGWSLSRGLYAR
jgi:hypothetical protein